MRRPAAAAFLLLALPAAWAQAPPASAATADTQSSVLTTCADCGVIRSVRRVETQVKPTVEDKAKPSGWIANFPFGGGKPTVGSSTDLGEKQKPPVVTYEIVVRLDDGRFRVVLQPDAENLRDGDRVKIVENKVVVR